MPAWHVRDRGYIHHDGQFRKPRKNNYAFVWPNDKKKGWWGRIGDIATNKGPDIFITQNANRTPTAADGPSRRRWTGFPSFEADPLIRNNDMNSFLGNFPLTGYSRDRRPYYDHQTRRFRKYPYDGMWTDIERNQTRPKIPNALETWPDMGLMQGIPFWGGTPYTDPRNTQRANGVAYGINENGGYWDPINNGWP